MLPVSLVNAPSGVRSVQLRVREMENAMVLEEAITRFMIFIYLVVIKGIIYSGEVLKKRGENRPPHAGEEERH